ncbi:hypothetical protein [Rhodoplanes sp. Z2-YC6860]|uniref:hypothetical protein n=1 Tax=Rhodoplanes sp. Z2-YC6860 TaxID=674703 RepID=UPI000833D734|nr:hypothetical protein [Rhodoplanes sp. Z2-YC6860]
MHKAVMLAAAATLLLLGPKGAFAYGNGPWCAVISVGGGFVSENCSMPSFEVCRQEASHFGPTSFCRQNGYFRGYAPEPSRHRAKKPKRKHRAQ